MKDPCATARGIIPVRREEIRFVRQKLGDEMEKAGSESFWMYLFKVRRFIHRFTVRKSVHANRAIRVHNISFLFLFYIFHLSLYVNTGRQYCSQTVMPIKRILFNVLY